MDLSKTPIAQRCHISFFGCTNAGKSSVVNAVVNQELSVVSDIKGTTTDPVKKTMELLPVGPVVIYDTAGYDDRSDLGIKRVHKTKEILAKTDIAILVVDIQIGLSEKDYELISEFKNRNIPYIIAYNKSDLSDKTDLKENEIKVSAKLKSNINELKEKIGNLAKTNEKEKFIITDKTKSGDTVILVIPVDSSAPKGRLILPQQNTLRELLDFHCSVICTQPQELEKTIDNLKSKPDLVITDSQAFREVDKIVPQDIPLTSFSILFARYKGDLDILINGAKKISELKNDDVILISEGCTHHRQCEDIGTVKIPKLIKKYTNKNLNFEFTSGGEFPDNLDKYSLVIHCGGCMLNEKEMKNRILKTSQKNIPIVNYGIAIAHMNGILKRATDFFSEHNL